MHKQDHNTILLRAPEPGDVDILYKWENNEEIWKVSNIITPFSKHILAKYIENAHLDLYESKQLRLMIDVVNEDIKQPKTIGTVDLFEFDPFHNRAGVGILIGETDERKKGYASMVLDKIIFYAFEILQLHQLFCNISEENTESLKLFKKKGFQVTGTKKEWLKTKNGYKDEYILQIINHND
ncbi:MAG: GNAT family N-acetyltransferase [Bacteroidales bacterium]|nr:GNAT family N-acetyltransferase [Bacteroidales bacterium]